MVILLAATCGAAVANLYYAQPLLHTLGKQFHVSSGATGLLVTLSQIGYVIGLALLVPLGDLLERRKLITVTLLCSALSLVLAALSPTFLIFGAAMLITGIVAFVAQVVVPMSAHLAAENERGRVVGTVMSGLLIGILLSRTASGLIAQWFGWRTVFACGAVLMLAMATLLRARLPTVAPTSDHSYGRALKSVLTLIREEPVLRQRMLLGACGMACFSVLWTAIAFLLSGEHGSSYHYGNATIGLFGLAGVAGASAAQVVGRLVDRGRLKLATSISIVLLLCSWGILALGAHNVIVLIIAIMVLDLGVQGLQVSNQNAIYARRPEARSRITTAYMVAYFLGGVLFSAVTGAIYAADGWYAVCVLGAIPAVIALCAWALSALRPGPVHQPESN
jgi:predicted MFS family arabinose efflux permease